MREHIKSFLKKWKTDYYFQTFSSSAVSMLISFVFTFYNGVLGIIYKSIWNGSICVYYLLLAGIRAVLVSSQRKKEKQSCEYQRKIYIATHIALILMNLSLIAPIALMVMGKRSYTLGLIPAIAMAAYTTYRITVSILHYRKSIKKEQILVSELRTINLIDSLVAVLTLQNTLIIANGGMSAEMRTISACSSAGVLLLIIIISLRSFLMIRRH